MDRRLRQPPGCKLSLSPYRQFHPGFCLRSRTSHHTLTFACTPSVKGLSGMRYSRRTNFALSVRLSFGLDGMQVLTEPVHLPLSLVVAHLLLQFLEREVHYVVMVNFFRRYVVAE